MAHQQQPKLARCRANWARLREPQMWPENGRFRSNLLRTSPPSLANFRPNRTNLARFQPYLGHLRSWNENHPGTVDGQRRMCAHSCRSWNRAPTANPIHTLVPHESEWIHDATGKCLHKQHDLELSCGRPTPRVPTRPQTTRSWTRRCHSTRIPRWPREPACRHNGAMCASHGQQLCGQCALSRRWTIACRCLTARPDVAKFASGASRGARSMADLVGVGHMGPSGSRQKLGWRPPRAPLRTKVCPTRNV